MGSIVQTTYPDISFKGLMDEKAQIGLGPTKFPETVSPFTITSTPEAPTFTQTTREMVPHMSTFLPSFSLEDKPPKRSPLLDLPLEIRLQIYSHLLPANPAKHAHLSPSVSYPPATSSAYFLRALSTTLALSFPNFEPAGKSEPAPFPAERATGSRGSGCGFIPAALQATCRQVYAESRMLPFEQNEFVFINWFCSGVYAARAFLRALKPWQRNGMRWARIEVLGRDLKDSWVATLVGGRAGGGEWKDLCNLWGGNANGAAGTEVESGLWGLRLGIKGRVGRDTTATTVDGSGGVYDPSKPADHGVLDVEAEWITAGIAQLNALRWMELDIEDDEIERDAKVAFCVALRKKLSSPGKRVDVLFVEKLTVETDKTKRTVVDEISWGEPGDDYIWGLDS